jgi:hypothetical protein
MDGEAILDAPMATVYLKYIGDPGLNQIWIYAHCLESAATSPIHVTHGFEIEGKLQEEEQLLSKAMTYEVDCASEPTNRYLRFAVDNLRTT